MARGNRALKRAPPPGKTGRRAAYGAIFIIDSPPSRFICPLSPRGRATFRLSRARILLNVNQMFDAAFPASIRRPYA
jgi:hypothetical protein